MAPSRRIGLARVMSKRGWCSRSTAERMIRAGQVRVRGRIVLDPETPTPESESAIECEGLAPAPSTPRYLMLNKPRGLLTSTRDEHGRDTVYRCFDGAHLNGQPLGWIAPVGRLDKASEGLLLFSNDPQWAASITDPASGPRKTYHVQIAGIPDARALQRMHDGVDDAGERLRLASVSVLRQGGRNAWLEIELDEGRNRQIRRVLAALDFEVLRLMRVAIGALQLGRLGKGEWRALNTEEVRALLRD